MRRSLERLVACTLTSLCLLLPAVASALPEDREKPIHIEADEALRDEKQGFTRYQGNVKLDQGSLHIEADEITVYHDDKQADRIFATGAPASLQQQPDVTKGLIKAKADKIEYIKSEQRVQLRENAHIEQDGSIVTGEVIDYLIDEQLVKAGSTPGSDTSRVQVVIPPQALEDEDQAIGDTAGE